MLDLGFVLALAILAAGVGLRLLDRLGGRPDAPADALALALPIGLGMLALTTLGLGEFGALNRAGLAIVLMVGAVLGGRDGWRAIATAIAWPRRPLPLGEGKDRPPLPPGEGWGEGASGAVRLLPSYGGRGGADPHPAFGHPLPGGEGKSGPLSPRERVRVRAGTASASAGLKERVPASATVGPHPAFGHPLPGGEGTEFLPLPPGEGWLTRRPRSAHLAGGLPDRAFALALAATLLGTLLTALAPVTDGDALCYHLQVPKVFLERGSVGFEPDLHETVYPLLTELLFAHALAFRGPVACRLLSWVLGLAFAASVTALARPSLGGRAWWAGTIALLVPAVSNGMSAPLNDVALAAFGAAAIVGWARFHDDPSPRRAALAGLLAGLALGVKYPALVLAGLLALAILASGFVGCVKRTEAQRGRPIGAFHAPYKATFIFAVSALLAGGDWYLRAWWHTGNPVYPFFRHVFGGAGLDEVLDPIKRPMAVNAWSLLTALGPLTLRPERFDSFAHQFGPLFLLFLPALLIERAPRRVLGIVALGYVFLMLCLTQRQSMRFVLIAVGPWSLGVAWLAREWWARRSWPGRALVAILTLALGFEASLALARARHGLAVVLGREDAASYLARREPTYRVGRWMAGHLPGDAHVVGQDHRGYYLPRPYTMELAHRRRTGLGRHGESARAVVGRLRRAGFTHVLLCPPVPETAVEFDPTLGRLLAPWLSGRPPLFRADLADGDGVVRRYAIYRLDDEDGVTVARGRDPGRGRR